MSFRVVRLAIVLGSCFLAVGCSSFFGGRVTTAELRGRLQAKLASDVAAKRVALQSVPGGTQVTMLDPSLFQTGRGALADQGHDVLSNIIESLMDPRLVEITVSGPSTGPDGEPGLEVQNVSRFFQDFGLGPELQSAAPQPLAQSTTLRTALTVTVNIQCLYHPDGPSYDNGQAKPSCN